MPTPNRALTSRTHGTAAALLTIRITAERLRVSTKTVRRLIHRGELAALHVGHGIRITEEAFRLYLNACR